VRDLTTYETFPFDGPLRRRELDAPVDEEPPRAGEGGRDCRSCTITPDETLWHGGNWFLTLYEPSPFPGVVILSPRTHAGSIAELPPARAQELGPMCGRVQRAIERLGGIGRVHVNLWGDGGAHLHNLVLPAPVRTAPAPGNLPARVGVDTPRAPDRGDRSSRAGDRAAMDEFAEA
jgi:diadenosine tetraphosphate (Ap4A) HIT family hydrolase